MKKLKAIVIISSVLILLIVIPALVVIFIIRNSIDTVDIDITYKPIKDPAKITLPYKPSALEIKTPQDLINFSNEVNSGNTFEGKTVELTDDITLNKNEQNNIIPIGSIYEHKRNIFKGNFNGNNHTIKGINISFDKKTEDNVECGLFGMIEDSEISNLTIEDSIILNTGREVGGIVGEAKNSIIKNCNCNAKVMGRNWSYEGISYSSIFVGGIAAQIYDSEIQCCSFGGDIDVYLNGNENSCCDDTKVGGIVGSNEILSSKSNQGVVRNSYNKGSIVVDGFIHPKVDNVSIGGVVGYNCYMVENCYNIGNITTNHQYGAIVSDNAWSDKASKIGVSNPKKVVMRPYVRNCYYLNTTSNKGLVKNTKDSPEPIALTEEQMKSIDFLNKLNEQSTKALKRNIYWSIGEDKNGGYPYLIDNN